MTNDLTFGQFISEQRQKHSMESQELAKALGISGAYLSQLERGVRTNPSTELLDKIAMVLCLNKIETETLYDLYAKVSGQISPDLAVYVSSSETVRQALRTARDADGNALQQGGFPSPVRLLGVVVTVIAEYQGRNALLQGVR